MRTTLFIAATVCILISTAAAQEGQKQITPTQNQVTLTENVRVDDKIVLSSESSTVRVAGPNETLAINGRLLHVSDLIAVLSSDNLLAPRPRTPESQTPAESQPIQQPSKKY